MLLGADLHIHTDHRNLTHTNLNTQRVLRWRLYLEDFHPTFHYVRGTDNPLANALSRVPQQDSSLERDPPVVDDDDATAYAYSILRDDESLLECFLHHPYLGEDLVFPLDYNIIYLHQQQDAQLQQLNQTQTLRYSLINFDDLQLICYVKALTEPWQIASS